METFEFEEMLSLQNYTLKLKPEYENKYTLETLQETYDSEEGNYSRVLELRDLKLDVTYDFNEPYLFKVEFFERWTSSELYLVKVVKAKAVTRAVFVTTYEEIEDEY